MLRSPSAIPFLLLLLPFLILSVSAQFGNIFDQLFQGQHQQQQHQQQQQQQQGGRERHAVSGWELMEQVNCNGNGLYLCPGTAACAKSPIECPCPYPEDTKCLLPPPSTASGSIDFICVRGGASACAAAIAKSAGI